MVMFMSKVNNDIVFELKYFIFKSSETTLSVTWNFTDPESNVREMKLNIYEARGGATNRIFPERYKFLKKIA